jgi:ABC-2 type transport system permease protein
MVLASLAGSSLGLTLGTAVKPDQIGALNALVIIPLIFTGCTYFSWSALSSIRWFQIVTLLNPLTYSTEGLRSTMMPPVHGLATSSLGLQWVLLGLFATIIVFLALGVRGFSKRAMR